MFIACFNPLFPVYFISCSIPVTLLFILCRGQSEISGYFFRIVRLSVDFLSKIFFAYFLFFVQELMRLLFLLLFFSIFAKLVEGLFYSNLLCNISCLGICLVLFMCIF